MPFSSLGEPRARTSRPSTPTASEPRAIAGPAHWQCFPDPLPEHRLLERETLAMIEAAIAELPERQHTVIMLRDVEGWSAEEVCQALAISEATSGCSCTAPARRSAAAWSPTSTRPWRLT